MIALQNVTKLYGSVIGVNDLTFVLEAGAHGLIGPNGSGKTTFINLLTGQLRPTLGKVQVLGVDPWRRRDVLRRIGLCPATDVLYPNVSAWEWVRYQLRLHGFSRQEALRRTLASLEQTGLTSAMHRPLGSYSLGMRQRAKIAQAIAHDPELLILDEPYNGLDPVGRRQMTDLLREWGAAGKSLLFASHVLHEIEAVTPSFLLIYGGRLLASGTAGEIQSLLADAPQEVVISGPDAGRLAQRLASQPWIDALRLLPEAAQVRVQVRQPQLLYRALPQWIVADDLRIEQLQADDGNLSNLFETLLRRHRGEQP